MTAIVEKWNPWAKIRQDLWGFGDILCFRGNEVMIVQTTSGANIAARKEKIAKSQAASLWIEVPTRLIVVHGWSRTGPRGKRKVWTCREVWVTREDLV